VPNHALIILGLLYGDGDLARSLSIVNTAGWDTDCNSGNLGCLLGIRNGLAALEALPALREPVVDRLYLSTADGGRGITDALTEAYHVVNSGRALAGQAPVTPKGGARFHFELPGSVQGFQAEDSSVRLENVAGHSRLGTRSLALRYRLAAGASGRASTPTFIPQDIVAETHYMLMAAPTLYPGQTVRAVIAADAGNDAPVSCRLFYRAYAADDVPEISYGPVVELSPGAEETLSWQLAGVESAAIMQIGVEVSATADAANAGDATFETTEAVQTTQTTQTTESADATETSETTEATGSVYLDALSWDGAPDVVFTRPSYPGTLWRRVWVNAMDHFDPRWPEPFHLSQDRGRGMVSTGTAEWTDYSVSATIIPHLAVAWGIAARVQGLRRYYALILRQGGAVQLVRMLEGETVLAESTLSWELDTPYTLRLQVQGTRLYAWVNDAPCLEAEDTAFAGGGVALICEEGRIVADAVAVRPASGPEGFE
jgi:hypothetical protein